MVNFTAPRSDRCPNNEPKQNNKPSDNKSNSGGFGSEDETSRGSLFSGASLVDQQNPAVAKAQSRADSGHDPRQFHQLRGWRSFHFPAKPRTPALAPYSTKCKFYFNSYYFKRPPPFALPRLVRRKVEKGVGRSNGSRRRLSRVEKQSSASAKSFQKLQHRG